MKKLSMVLSSLVLLSGCLLEQDLGENQKGVNGTGSTAGSAGAASGGSSASGGSAGASTGGTAGSATGGFGGGGTGGTGTGGFGAGGSGTGGVGTGGFGAGGSGTGGAATGGTGGTGTGGTGGNGTGYDTVGAGLYFSSVQVSGNDVYWTTTGDTSSTSGSYGMVLKQPKTTTWTSGSPIPTGTQTGFVHGAARTLIIDGPSAYVWYSQIMLGWQGGGASKITLANATGVDFLDAVGPGVATYATQGDNLIALDSTYIYFLCDEFFFDRGICRYPKNPGTGASFELVVDDPPHTITNIGATATHVYYTTNSGSLMRIAKGALPNKEEVVGATAKNPTSMVVDGSDVYVLGHDTSSNALKLTKFSNGAGPGTDLHSATGASGSLVVDGSHAYFVNRNSDTLSKVAKAGGAATVVVDLSKSTKYELGDFDVDSSHVFFAAMASNGAPLADLIQRAPK